MRFLILTACLVAFSAAAPQQFGGGFGYTATGNTAAALQQSSRDAEKYLPPATTTEEPIVHKQFFLIAAPDDQENTERSKHLVLGRPQKNYRVLFIKAPASDNDGVKLSAEFAPQEEKTVIYVLSKKDNDLNANDIATPEPTQPTKPEVYFIKYKTPEEAAAAQKEIQDQYDKLGGTAEYNDEGFAPLTSIVGTLDGATPDGAYDYKQIQRPDGSSHIQQYLTRAALK